MELEDNRAEVGPRNVSNIQVWEGHQGYGLGLLLGDRRRDREVGIIYPGPGLGIEEAWVLRKVIGPDDKMLGARDGIYAGQHFYLYAKACEAVVPGYEYSSFRLASLFVRS